MGIEMFVWVLDVQPWVWIIGLAGGRQEDGDSVLYGNCKSWGGGGNWFPRVPVEPTVLFIGDHHTSKFG
jgi:hypothetical protein